MKHNRKTDGVKAGDLAASIIIVAGFLVMVGALILKLVGVLK